MGITTKSPDMVVRMDDWTNQALDDYAQRLYPDQSGKGNRSEAVRQILRAVLGTEQHPEVQKILKQNFILGGDVVTFLRAVVENYFSQRNNMKADFSLGTEGK